jgi:hypothetical protein
MRSMINIIIGTIYSIYNKIKVLIITISDIIITDLLKLREKNFKFLNLIFLNVKKCI